MTQVSPGVLGLGDVTCSGSSGPVSVEKVKEWRCNRVRNAELSYQEMKWWSKLGREKSKGGILWSQFSDHGIRPGMGVGSG